MMQNQINRETLIPQVSWRTIPIGEEWNSMFKSFQHSAYRLETLQAYAEPSEASPFNQYLRGVLPNPSFMADWCCMVRAHVDSGRSMRRVHIVDVPLSEYMKFEVECCYRDSSTAGEEVLLLDRTTLSPDLVKVTREDFWFFDGSTVMVNDYDEQGALYQARITSAPEAVKYYASIAANTWSLGVPFKEFYKAHSGIEL